MPKKKAKLLLLNDQDYTLGSDGRCWITVGNLSVHIVKTDEGVVVDIYGVGMEMYEPIATTYAFDREGEEDAELQNNGA